MAVPLTKRRKTSHSPSPAEDDAASFASFGDSAEEDVATNEPKHVRNDDDEDMDESSGEESESTETGKQETSVAARKSTVNGTRHLSSQAVPVASATAYTGGTFKSNMFKLQVDELLSHVRVKHGKKESAAEAALHKLKNAIDAIPTRPALPIADAERDLIKKGRVAIPFPNPRPAHDVKYKLEYAKPGNINVVGSYPLKLALKTAEILSIDMVVMMPASLFQDKDYLNHRYFYKRAYYLSCIAAGLKKTCADEYTIEFDSFHGNPLLPIIAVQSKQKHNWRINILPCVASDTFAKEKLLPSKNCVRPIASEGSEDVGAGPTPTPFYNSSLQADSQASAYLRLVHAASSSCEAFVDACLLGRVWLRQRGLGSNISQGGFGNFEWAALVAILLQTGGSSGSPVLSPGYSSYQLFKATLQYLAAKDLVKQPAMLQAGDVQTNIEDGHPLCFDGPRSHNLLFKMTSWSYKQLRVSARTTLSVLGDTLSDPFEATFILRENTMLLRHDYMITIPVKSLSTTDDFADRDALDLFSRIYLVMKRGLGDRVTQINLQAYTSEKWDLGSARPSPGRKGDITIGLIANSANVGRAVDHGPSAENKKEAAAFRQFWGEKAELRRFKDGSILESLVWSSKENCPTVVQQIVVYLLARHFGQTLAKQITFAGDGFARLLRNNSGTTPFQPFMEAFKTLETHIRGMEGLPLTVRHIMPVDPQLRYTSVEVPLSDAQKSFRSPANVIVQFEGSGRWPDDLVAIQRTKIAFLLKLGQLFDALDSVTTSRLGLENEETDILNQAFLDIIYSDGATFRLRIHHDREQTLNEQTLKNKSSDPKTREAAALALAAYRRDYVKGPAHTQAVQKLCTRFPVLSPSIRLMKKWFSSHLLANHFPDELVELLVIHTFTRPAPWQTPSSAQTGFLRTLAFLSRWDWRTDPVLVDMGGDLKTDEAQAMRTRFDAWRKLDPALNRVVLFAASSVDPEGTAWTDGAPAKVVAGRMSALAKAAVQEVETKALALDPVDLFVSPSHDYDVVIHLNTAYIEGDGSGKKGKPSQFKNLALGEGSNTDLVGYQPASAFLKELEMLYGQTIMFFHGGKNGRVIAGLWSPHTARRSWKVNLTFSTVPLQGAGGGNVEAEINKSGIVAEIARLGGELVERVEVHR